MKFTAITEFTGTISALKNYEGVPCRVVGINEDGDFVVLVATDEGDLYPMAAGMVRPDIEASNECPECGVQVRG